MKLPVQAHAVVRGSLTWPVWPPARQGAAVPSLLPSSSSVHCTSPTPSACVCDNGIATCCATGVTCEVDSATGACNCVSRVS
jgi:hypothetical protein